MTIVVCMKQHNGLRKLKDMEVLNMYVLNKLKFIIPLVIVIVGLETLRILKLEYHEFESLSLLLSRKITIATTEVKTKNAPTILHVEGDSLNRNT